MRIPALATFLSFVCLLVACGPSTRAMRVAAGNPDEVDADDEAPVTPDGGGGAHVTSVGGSGGGAGPSGGAGGDDARGGAGGAGGAELPDAAVDAPVAADSAVDAGKGNIQDARPDGMYWQVFCPTDAGESRTECCASYCSCMVRNCASELPADCMNTCVTVKNWDLSCRIHNCYLSISPNSPQDHDSHCGHADGKNGKCTNR